MWLSSVSYDLKLFVQKDSELLSDEDLYLNLKQWEKYQRKRRRTAGQNKRETFTNADFRTRSDEK